MVDNVVSKRPLSHKTKTRKRGKKLQHLCLDKAHNSEPEEQEIITREYVMHIPHKRKRNERGITQHCSNRKKHSAKRWAVERIDLWHNRFRKLFTRHEKKIENYLGLVRLSCYMIIYRKTILGWGLNL